MADAHSLQGGPDVSLSRSQPVWADQLAPGKIVAPGGIAVDAAGTVYVSVNSVFARRGRVIAITQS